MAKTRSVSSLESPKAARASGRPKPPASWRYFSMMSRKLGDWRGRQSYPKVGARLAVGQVDVKKICFGGASETLEQLLRAMAGTKRLGSRHGNAADVVQAGYLLARKPEPGPGAIAAFARAHLLL